MAEKPKGGLAIILEAGKPKGPKGSKGLKGPSGLLAEEDESEGSEGLAEAAALVRDALKSDDDDDLAMALKEFVRMCSEG